MTAWKWKREDDEMQNARWDAEKKEKKREINVC